MFGYSKKVLNDNGPPFHSYLLKLFFEFLNNKHRKITPRYPQANGITKNFIKVLAKAIKI